MSEQASVIDWVPPPAEDDEEVSGAPDSLAEGGWAGDAVPPWVLVHPARRAPPARSGSTTRRRSLVITSGLLGLERGESVVLGALVQARGPGECFVGLLGDLPELCQDLSGRAVGLRGALLVVRSDGVPVRVVAELRGLVKRHRVEAEVREVVDQLGQGVPDRFDALRRDLEATTLGRVDQLLRLRRDALDRRAHAGGRKRVDDVRHRAAAAVSFQHRCSTPNRLARACAPGSLLAGHPAQRLFTDLHFWAPQARRGFPTVRTGLRAGRTAAGPGGRCRPGRR